MVSTLVEGGGDHRPNLLQIYTFLVLLLLLILCCIIIVLISNTLFNSSPPISYIFFVFYLRKRHPLLKSHVKFRHWIVRAMKKMN